MAKHFAFLSYKRGELTTPAVERLFRCISVQLRAQGVEAFFDRKSIEAGDSWENAIDTFLAKATHFIALISIDFWLSEQCRRELDLAVARYLKEGKPRLLFVLADHLNPSELAFDEREAEARVAGAEVADAAERVRRVKGLGEFNFLGPYTPSGALVRLEVEDKVKVEAQINQLIQAIKSLKELA